MANQSAPINQKVTYATGGAAGGYTLGKAVSVILLFYVIGEVPGEVKLAIEFICEGGIATLGALGAGYMKREQ